MVKFRTDRSCGRCGVFYLCAATGRTTGSRFDGANKGTHKLPIYLRGDCIHVHAFLAQKTPRILGLIDAGRFNRDFVEACLRELIDKLGLEPGQPGSIHFGSESRGFDEEFFQQLLSEHKEIKLSRGVRTVVWKRIRDRNEGLDMTVMVLCLLDVFRSQIDRMAEPQIVQENGEKGSAQPEPGRATWGAQTLNVTDPYIQMLQREQQAQRVQQVPNGMRWGVQNKGVQW
jgi:hypothetical protein